ncbi:lipopolysaccharide assembly protein LapB [Paenarthrobacter ilicis]|uniref:Lipopolysaccharide biosynthesis regulator YciM n=1 Tax=Paenarthrobacter ilicis TaxID=43665 RepID=A0ABX0TK42_9MICC|nr:tetratricopeptide repeat protein [Paenarthrobacter ilicis]MBM7793391.1 lipopolysaccharide biosynthesis regulator YciM [Paenarthrobacter ilicis]NIJ01833.1 lipopolysaccharide biosynthesis regulator YciM [Paenarthrobacter ilicis]
MTIALQDGVSDWPTAGFPGVRTNPDTLLPVVVNDEAMDSALAASEDPADRIMALLLENQPKEAAELLAEARYKDPESFRLRIFEAEVHRATNRHDRAIQLFRHLLHDVQGSTKEAIVRQYLGRAYFVGGNPLAASEEFAKALDLRVAMAADASLIYSSAVALQRARDVLELAS